MARKAMAAGDYRWSSDLLDKLVFADPANKPARAALADSYEQQGYQAESAIWRNQFLSAAKDLREGAPRPGRNAQGEDMIAAVPTRLLLDSAATRYDPARLGRSRVTLDLAFPERKENASLEAGATTLFGRDTRAERPDATLTGPRRLILGVAVPQDSAGATRSRRAQGRG